MHIRFFPVMLVSVLPLYVGAQSADSVKTIRIDEVTVRADSYATAAIRSSALAVEVAESGFLTEHFTGNLMQALEYLPGVRSMDVGAGFSKPMIRGMGFNRVSVVRNGIKQEGQQWGSDHGLEVDAFGVERVVVHKGPSSLLYGSDAMGGVIEIVPAAAPAQNRFFGEIVGLTKSVNGNVGASLMAGVKKDSWLGVVRYSEQRFGDYRVPADTMVYLTQRIPIHGRRLKNTAGHERSVSLDATYRSPHYHSVYSVSNVWQKTGFFPGAHGIPDIGSVGDDGNRRNVDLPCSDVNHLRITTSQQYQTDRVRGVLDLGYQNNLRREWSRFHTHYGTQPPPEIDPDKELEFRLHTLTAAGKVHWEPSPRWRHSFGFDAQAQYNRTGGYSFLLPEYDRSAAGVFVLTEWQPSRAVKVSGGARYDRGWLSARAYRDVYLEQYLRERGYDESLVADYRWRSYEADRRFGDFSGSAGVVWSVGSEHILKANLGHSFRLPGANELASNGVHHGTFRHEQGDPTLGSERGWQLDASWVMRRGRLLVSVSPFVSWFTNYIFLQPTGQWSVLPHAGQIYRYTQAAALFAGGELSVQVEMGKGFGYSHTSEYVYTLNLDERLPLSFSPPASMRNVVSWGGQWCQIFVELHSIASQRRVAQNESPTAGANLVNAGVQITLPERWGAAEVVLSARNLFDAQYFNHLSFYRKVELPEPGRNLQILIKFSIK